MKLLRNLKVKIWKANNTYQCSISLLIERKTDASRFMLLILLPMTQVQVSYTVLQDSASKITKCVSLKESSILTIHPYLSIKTVNLPRNVQYTKESTLRMQIKLLSRILRIKDELFRVVLKSITILIVGEVILPLFIKLFPHGLSRLLTLRRIWLRIIIKHIGSLRVFNKRDSITG